jgi:hypothetical protein
MEAWRIRADKVRLEVVIRVTAPTLINVAAFQALLQLFRIDVSVLVFLE